MGTAMNADLSQSTAPRLKFRGIHHLVLNTDDIKKTIDFYWGVLGMPLVHAMRVPPGVGGALNRGNPPYENIRHYFFDMGEDSLLAFFEIPKGEKSMIDRNGLAAMQHVSFSLSPSQMESLVKRLDDAGVDRIGPMEAAPGCFSVYFYDPNGCRLEVSCQYADGEQQQVLGCFKQTPEKMLKELGTVTNDEKWLAWVTSGLKE
jgi:catechol 2,3-dioxygenase-like lactoylglutathione lyase family enzyme